MMKVLETFLSLINWIFLLSMIKTKSKMNKFQLSWVKLDKVNHSYIFATKKTIPCLDYFLIVTAQLQHQPQNNFKLYETIQSPKNLTTTTKN